MLNIGCSRSSYEKYVLQPENIKQKEMSAKSLSTSEIRKIH